MGLSSWINPTAVWWTVGVFGAAGVIALMLGWRGRRVGTAPHCRRCRYELGVELDGDDPRCPECGARLGAPHATEPGRRASSRPVLIAGAVLLVLSGAWWGAARALRGLPPASRPTWWLTQDLATPDTRARVVAELADRAVRGVLSESAMRSISALMLDIHGDAEQAWTGELADLLLATLPAAENPEAAMARIAGNALTFQANELEAAETIAFGAEVLPFTANVVLDIRGLYGLQRERLQAAFADPDALEFWRASRSRVLVDGQPLEVARGGGHRMVLFADAAAVPVGSWGTVDLKVRAPDGTIEALVLEPGEHTLTIETDVYFGPRSVLDEIQRERAASSDGPIEHPGIVHTETHRLEARFTVAQPDEAVVIRPVRSSRLASQYAGMIRVMNGPMMSDGDPGEASVRCDLKILVPHLPGQPGLAHRLMMLIGNETVPFGSVATSDSAFVVSRGGSSSDRHIVLPERVARVSHVRLFLEPDAGLTAGYVRTTSYLDERIDLGWHEVNWLLPSDRLGEIVDLSDRAGERRQLPGELPAELPGEALPHGTPIPSREPAPPVDPIPIEF